MALIRRDNVEEETPKAVHSADTRRDIKKKTEKQWSGTERKNVKVDPPVLDLIKVMCNMTDKTKSESKAYGLVKTAVEEYLVTHFTEREQEIIKNSVEIKYK